MPRQEWIDQACRKSLLVAILAIMAAPAGAQGDVTPTGTYTTRVDVPVPQAPGAPTLSLEYNSASGLGVAGGGWDLSVGWPTLIARDTRFGTPAWDINSTWLWGNSPLVSVTPGGCTTPPCIYRTAPDSLAKITIEPRSTVAPYAEVVLPNGTVLSYEPVIYDSTASPAYPEAPAGHQTTVFAFLLKSIKTPNGYLTCFRNRHWGDTTYGRAAVTEEILYGAALKDCSSPPPSNEIHRIVLNYVDPTLDGYFAPTSFRFGVPVSFNNLLKDLTIYAADFTPGASGPAQQTKFRFEYQSATATETRLPRLEKIVQEGPAGSQSPNPKTRTLRWFAYGDRNTQFGAPQLIDLGEPNEFAPSLAGSVTRPMRNPHFFNNPNGVFQMGHDQADEAAPPTHASTEQWSLTDLNGDGLLDFYRAAETGQGTTWPTFETTQNPAGPRPPQQQVRIHEGISSDRLATTALVISTNAASTLEADYSPDRPPATDFTPWIWAEGRGLTRTGMPVSVSAPEIRNIASTCPPAPGEDSRLWPVLPDGTLGGSQASVAEQLQAASVFSLDRYDTSVTDLVGSIRAAYQPSYSVSATLSGWLDLTGDGLPDFIATPGFIERFATGTPFCARYAREPSPVTKPNGDVDGDWYVASLSENVQSPTVSLDLKRASGPRGLVGLPLDYQVATGSPESFGFTLPIGSLLEAAGSVAAGGTAALAAAVPGLIVEAFSPHSSTGAGITGPSPSHMGFLYGLANVAAGTSSIPGFVSSTLKVNFDLTVLSTKSRNRSESRAQVMDINADGLPDYVLYDSGTRLGGSPGGALVGFLNSPKGFSTPQVLNSGFDYTTNRPDLAGLTRESSNADKHASVISAAPPPLNLGIAEICKIPIYPGDPLAATKVAACAAILVEMKNMASTASAAVKLAEDFLTSTTDTIPAERFHLDEAKALATALDTAFVAQTAAPLSIPFAADLDKELILSAAKAVHLLERTCRQLDYRSRINVPSRGFSELDGALLTDSATGLSVQTRGLVDLNGDALPDYVITEDREKTCGQNQWEVFWGTGSSSLAGGRAFASRPSCIDVPLPPDDIKKRGYTTLPMNVDMMNRAPTANAKIVDTTLHSYISLNDFNHDGRPDLIMAGEGSDSWVANASARSWRIYLNKGRGFDLTAKLQVASPSANLAGVSPASTFTTGLGVPYPRITTTHVDASILFTRDRIDTHAGLIDVDGDGVSEIVRRVTYSPSGGGTPRAGLLVWNRKGNAPQDLLVEERDPLDGSRVSVTYLPASQFQWKDGLPDGKAPAGGHHQAGGSAAYLVRSITSEPFLGRSTRRTRTGYDYKAPYFDPVLRAFAGFRQITTAPLDPATGAVIASSASTIAQSPQSVNGRGGQTQLRVVESSTGAPVNESLMSYVEVVSADQGPGAADAYFSEQSDRITVEFPHEVKKGAVLDIGFDGRQPLANRGNPAAPYPIGSPNLDSELDFDAGLPTGGGVTLNQRQSPQWIQLVSPHPELDLKQLTLETWVSPSAAGSRAVVAKHPNGYELAIESSGDVTFGVHLAGTWTPRVNGGVLPTGRWSHVVASYDGNDLRIFVNGVQTGSLNRPGVITYTQTSSAGLMIGCGAQSANCFQGSLGEFRIYPEAWKSPARITRAITDYNGIACTAGRCVANVSAPNFGTAAKTRDYGDIATLEDDVVEEQTYALPVSGTKIQNAVATRARRVLHSDGVTAGGYLGYSEANYDGLPLGQVASGNATRNAVYSGRPGVSTKPKADVVTETSYTEPSCPGVATQTKDPEGAVTKVTVDQTCTFQLTTVNALGHTLANEYFGVAGTGYRYSPAPGIQFGGLYGQTKSVTDANGARTLTNYDEWGRVTATVSPFQTARRPGSRTEYLDAQCRAGSGPGATRLPCDHTTATDLASPTRVTVYTWDDMRHDYRVAHTFGDGQVQTEVVNQGKPDWLISGTQDYDALGRVITTYKPRYLPASAAPTTDPCPAAGDWCDSQRIKGNPLRDPASVAHVQTAYDIQSRVIRIYGPDVPACPDPSASDASGNLLCDAIAHRATPPGHFTQFEYPTPGAVRTIDGRGVPSVTRRDALGRLERVEEYLKASSTPYSTSQYAYDRNGNIREIKDIKGNTATAVYDALGRKTSSTDPNMGTWTYKYDRRGQLTEQEDARGALTKNQYDVLGRLIRTEYWTPPVQVPLGCGEVKPIEPRRPQLGPNGRLPGHIPEIPYKPCRYSCPGCPPPPPGTIVCSDPPIGLGKSLWQKAPQFTNQTRLTPRPGTSKWKHVSLTPLTLAAGDSRNGLASLPLPFDFALTPMRVLTLDGTDRILASPVPDAARWPAGHRLLISTNGKILFARSNVDEAIRTELTRPDNTQLPAPGETALYPFWDDLEMSGGISYAVTGQAPHRELIVQWDGVYGVNQERRVLFRAVLSESSYEIEFQYGALDLGSSSATIGLQYQSPTSAKIETIEYSFNKKSVAAGDVLTSLRRVADDPVQFSNGSTYGIGERLWGRFAFPVDLKNFTEAELSFKHSWNTRCSTFARGSCPVDRMSVMGLVNGRLVPLLSNATLTSEEAFNLGLDSMAQAPTVRVPFPRRLLGKKVTILFGFETVDTGTAELRHGWIVDQVKVTGRQRCTRTERTLEDVVERRYDSAEPAFSYESSKPVLDITFDVPGMTIDRSPLANEVISRATGSEMGVSGQGLKLDGTADVEVSSTKLPDFKQALSVEAWVNPKAAGSLQNLITKEGTFALFRTASEKLQCSVNVGATWHDAVSAGLLPSDTWTHVVMTYDGSAVRCYINGVEDGARQVSGNLGRTAAPLYLGRGASGNSFVGLIDEVRVLPAVRSATELLADAQLPHRGGPPRGNVLDLRFVDPQSWGADSSGAGNDAAQVQATLLPGIQGTAAQFDGSPNHAVMVPPAPSLDSDEVTAEVWLKTVSAGDRLLVGKWNGVEPGWRLALQEKTGQVRFEVRSRVETKDTWTNWQGDTTGLRSQGNGWCGMTANSPTARRVWVAPATGSFTFTTLGGASWDTVIFVRDMNGHPLGCNDNAVGFPQSSLSIQAVQGEAYQVFVSGSNGASGPFNLAVTGPRNTSTAFVTLERVNDGKWHHVAGVYDGKSLRVYIDGQPAHRTCRKPDVEVEGRGTIYGEEIPCKEVPEERCTVEWERVDNRLYPNAICVAGSILNPLPVYAGNYDPRFFPGHPSLGGMEDEIRISNYPKRDFEVAASARLYSAYTRVLGRQVELRNRTSTDHVHYDLLGQKAGVYRSTRLLAPGVLPLIGKYVSRTAYDNLGRTAALRYPDGEVVVNIYDRAGTQVSVIGYGNFMGRTAFGRQPYLASADVNSTGKIQRLQFGNRVTTAFTYDEGPTSNQTGTANTNGTFGKELLSRQTTTLPGGQLLQDQCYTYDPVGNLNQRIDFPTLPNRWSTHCKPLSNPAPLAPPLHNRPLLTNYAYDELSRLKTFDITFDGAGPRPQASYGYDELGNLTSKEGLTLKYGVDSTRKNCGRTMMNMLPHAVTQVVQNGIVTDYCYDAVGSIVEIRKGGTAAYTFQHNAAGKLTGLKNRKGNFAFTYDGNGERVHKLEFGRITTEPFAFYRQTDKGTEKYYFSGGRRIARRINVNPADVFWYHPEHLGGTNTMTDSSGSELQDAYSEYEPFGSALPNADNNRGSPPPAGYANTNTPDTNKNRSGGFQFTGKELDESGLYYYGARYYDPAVGRFLTADTVTPGTAPQLLNRYSYVSNNPLKFVDPTGHQPRRASSTTFVDRVSEWISRIDQALGLDDPTTYGPQPDRPVTPAPFPPAALRLPEFQWRAPMSEFDRQLWELEMSVRAVAVTMDMAFTTTQYLCPHCDVMFSIPGWYRRAPGLAFSELGSASLLDKGFKMEVSMSRSLRYRAEEFTFLLDPMAQRRRTMSVVRHIDPRGQAVDIVAGSTYLTRTQKVLAARLGMVPARFGVKGMHAEGRALSEGVYRGLEPVAGGTSRKICSRCTLFDIEHEVSGGVVTGDREFIFPKTMERVKLIE